MTLINALLSQTIPFAPISAHVTQHELRHCLKTSHANHVFVHANLLPVALSACHDLGIPEDHVYILEGNAPRGFRSFDGMIIRAKTQSEVSVPIKQAKKDTLAYLMFSSGTSGLPKGKQAITLNE
jgi:long-subunit acyl-CoA synthetase (AMP-forming)